MENRMKFQTEPVTMWFDRRLAVRRSSIHGYGTFATEDIPAGEKLMWVSGGTVYTPEDWKSGKVQLAPEMYNESQLDDDLFVATPKSVYYYVNHSCDPAMLNFTAFRNIEAGEEITSDYIYAYAYPSFLIDPCTCGSPVCRGKVTGDDWKLPELQEKYRGYFSPYIEKLIREDNPKKGK